jgi:hypothetical protein
MAVNMVHDAPGNSQAGCLKQIRPNVVQILLGFRR